MDSAKNINKKIGSPQKIIIIAIVTNMLMLCLTAWVTLLHFSKGNFRFNKSPTTAERKRDVICTSRHSKMIIKFAGIKAKKIIFAMSIKGR